MDWVAAARDFGWLGALALFIAREVWPNAFRLYSKAREREMDAKLETVRAQQVRELEAIKTERESRQAEREYRHELDTRFAVTIDKLAENSIKQTELIAGMGQQLSTTVAGLQALTTFMVSYTSDMRVNVAKMMELLEASSDDIRSLDRAHGLRERGKAGTNPLTPPGGEAVKTSTPEKKE